MFDFLISLISCLLRKLDLAARKLERWLLLKMPRCMSNLIRDNRAIAFSLKEFVFFLLIFIGTGVVTAVGENFLGDWMGFALFGVSIVPVLIIYIIWKNWGQKATT